MRPLNANLKAIIAGLEGTSLDLSSISANRVRLDDPETGRSMEAIRFTDSVQQRIDDLKWLLRAYKTGEIKEEH